MQTSGCWFQSSEQFVNEKEFLEDEEEERRTEKGRE